MSLSNRTIGILAAPFESGAGPSHSTIDLVFADAVDYLPQEGNKLERVLYGLRRLRDGVPSRYSPDNELEPDEKKLIAVVEGLADRLLQYQYIDRDRLDEALAADGLHLDERGHIRSARPQDEPADRLQAHVTDLFGSRDEFKVARRHYEQAGRAFDRGDYEAANAQFRSALDATFDTLAHGLGCPSSKQGGKG